MLRTIRSGGSLRTRIGLGMAVAVLPLAASAIAGYIILSRGVVVSFHDVASRQRAQIDPVQRLRVLLLAASAPLDDFADAADSTQPPKYHALRRRIDSAFVTVNEGVQPDHALSTLVDSARRDWTAADQLAEAALSSQRPAGDPQDAALVDRFQDITGSAVATLEAVYEAEARDVRRDHDAAIQAFRESERFSLVAGLGSLAAILLGMYIIGRVMASSVERLVSGAERFASGDREHRIDISVPPELHRVAEEFNRMIGRIHASEDALAELARRDAVTQLLNRRAFDEALIEALARRDRLGESFALLMLDLDHFKRVNDSYGHAAGDDVLRSAAEVLAAGLRPFDRAYRVGGEEFAVILAAADSGTVGATAERLRQNIEGHPTMIGSTPVTVTASVGAAIIGAGMDGAAIVAAADGALYRAKKGGRNRIELHAPLTAT